MNLDPTSKLSLYDFLSYLFIGFVGLGIIYSLVGKDITDFLLTTNFKNIFIFEDMPREMKYILLFAISYVFGHLISFVSSFSIEEYAKFIYGQPSIFFT